MPKQNKKLPPPELLSESASVDIGPGFLSRVDRLFRRIVPGYNYLRGKRGGSGTSVVARDVVAARLRARNAMADARRNINPDVVLEAGISKSEFCSRLDTLLRKQLLKQQQQGTEAVQTEEVPREVPVDVLVEVPREVPVDVLVEVPREVPVDVLEEVPEEQQAEGALDIQIEEVRMEDLPMEHLPMEDAPMGDIQTENPQPGDNQNEETPVKEKKVQKTKKHRGKDRTKAR